MASRKLAASSSSLVAKLSNYLTLTTSSSSRIPTATSSFLRAATSISHHHSSHHLTMRHFSNGGGDDDDDDDKDKGGDDDNDKDVFGVGFDDSNLRDAPWGPADALPPVYKRDAATGRFTGDIHLELSDEQRQTIQADDFQRNTMFKKRVEEYWKEKNDNDDGSNNNELNALGKRIREAKMALNVLGRSVQAQAATERGEDGVETGRDVNGGGGFSQRLTQEEFESFQEYMKKRYKVEVPEDEMPVLEQQGSKSSRYYSAKQELLSPDDSVLATKWMTSQAQRQMDANLDDNPYKDLMPADLSPRRVVNRKQAKLIPVSLLHHNNIPLLQSFLTETGQIKSRIQSRLGARDQRRIARLVKRSRCLGLMPYQGQFRSEQHGWVHANDLDEPRPWEKELERRGLVIHANNKDRKASQQQGGGSSSGEEA